MKGKHKHPSKYILGKEDSQKESKYIRPKIEDIDIIYGEEFMQQPIEPEKKQKSKLILTKKQIKERAKSKADGKTIRKTVPGSKASSYLLESFVESKAFLKENIKFTRIYTSVVALFLAVSIVLLSVFFALTAKQEKILDKRTQVYNELRNWLDEENRAYMAEVLLNPSIYYALDSRRQFEQYLFKYTFSISYGSTKQTFSTFPDRYNTYFSVSGGQHVILTFTESYTPIALKYLSEDTLKMYSLFVSPIKDSEDYKLRDYRTFLNIGEVMGYKAEDGKGLVDAPDRNFDMRVETTMTGEGNTYTITLYNFIGSANAVAYIDFELNGDQLRPLPTSFSSSYFPDDSRKLTTSEAIVDYEDFESPLAIGSFGELNFIDGYLKSVPSSSVTSGDYPLTLREFKALIQSVIGSGGLLDALSSESRFYIDSALKNETLDYFGQSGVLEVQRVLKDLTALKDLDDDKIIELTTKTKKELFDECLDNARDALNTHTTDEIISKLTRVRYAFSSSDYDTINRLFNKSKTEPLNESELIRLRYLLAHILYYNHELELASAKAVSLIRKMYGFDFAFSKDLDLIDLAENYDGTLSTAQKRALEKVLEVYSDDNISEISMSFYTLNSLIKAYNLDSKLGSSHFIIHKEVTGI